MFVFFGADGGVYTDVRINLTKLVDRFIPEPYVIPIRADDNIGLRDFFPDIYQRLDPDPEFGGFKYVILSQRQMRNRIIMNPHAFHISLALQMGGAQLFGPIVLSEHCL